MYSYVITISEPFSDALNIVKVFNDFKKVSDYLLNSMSEDFLSLGDCIRVQVWDDGTLTSYYAYENGRLELLWEGE